MRCYRCDSVLSETGFCNGCGADVRVYKKIVKLSNTYYNMGLDKAKIRDLTGAIDMLRRSVRINKKNTNARNLLGLVYFEMGEFVTAMSEWVISKNLQPEKNLADVYLKAIQDNPGKLEAISNTIKKYNMALTYVGEESEDLAIIQLKRIVAVCPNFIRGQQLLTLLYMHSGFYDKARRVINRILEIDTNNTAALRYKKELDDNPLSNANQQIKEKPEDITNRPVLSGNDVIIPSGNYKDNSNSAMMVINIVIGLVIGAALVFLLITPAKEKQVKQEYNDQLIEYQADIAKLNANISDMQKTVDTLTADNESYKTQADVSAKNQEIITNYQKVLSAYQKYIAKDNIACATILTGLDSTKLTDDALAVYDILKKETFAEATAHFYELGVTAFDAKNYQDAKTNLSSCVITDPTNIYAWYALGVSYKMLNNDTNDEQSLKCFNKVIELAPNTNYENWARYEME